MKKKLGLKKKHFIILIVSLCAVALVAEGILLAHIFATKDKKSKSKPTPTPDSALEAEYEEFDENLAEEVRYCIEDSLVSIETYDEMSEPLADKSGDIAVFYLTNDSLRYLYDLPKMKEYLDYELDDSLSKGQLHYISEDKLTKGNLFKSKKYKHQVYCISIKLPDKKHEAMTVKGTWYTSTE